MPALSTAYVVGMPLPGLGPEEFGRSWESHGVLEMPDTLVFYDILHAPRQLLLLRCCQTAANARIKHHHRDDLCFHVLASAVMQRGDSQPTLQWLSRFAAGGTARKSWAPTRRA